MPRNSSDMRKYLLALSSDDSSPWSHRLGGGSRKPEGGGPEGVAARCAEDEKFAAASARSTVEGGTAARGRREATSLAIDCGEAMFRERGLLLCCAMTGGEAMADRGRADSEVARFSLGHSVRVAADWLAAGFAELSLPRESIIKTSPHLRPALPRLPSTTSESPLFLLYLLIMFRSAVVRSLRASVPRTVRASAARQIQIAPAVRPSQFVPAFRAQSLRFYSAPASLSKDEVEGRIVNLLKNFDKVCYRFPRLGFDTTQH
jgi:hypothetical protein